MEGTRRYRMGGRVLYYIRDIRRRSLLQDSPRDSTRCGARQALSTPPVSLYGLLPREPGSDAPCLTHRFMSDSRYASWRQFYLSAGENIEIRRKEKPQALSTCRRAPTRNFPSYPGVAVCCLAHHLEHVFASFELSQHVCELEMEAAVAYSEWLGQHAASGRIRSRSYEEETEVTEAYVSAIRVRLDKLKVARLAFNAARQEVARTESWERLPDTVFLQRLRVDVPGYNIEDLLTPFPVRRTMTPEELEEERERLSRLSRHELELEKVRPERIEFLCLLFESYKTGAYDEASQNEIEYAQRYEQQHGGRECPGRQARRSRRRLLMPDESAYERPMLQRFHGLIQPPRSSSTNADRTKRRGTIEMRRRHHSRRLRQLGQQLLASQRERRGAVLLRGVTLQRERQEERSNEVEAQVPETCATEEGTPEDTDKLESSFPDYDGQWN